MLLVRSTDTSSPLRALGVWLVVFVGGELFVCLLACSIHHTWRLLIGTLTHQGLASAQWNTEGHSQWCQQHITPLWWWQSFCNPLVIGQRMLGLKQILYYLYRGFLSNKFSFLFSGGLSSSIPTGDKHDWSERSPSSTLSSCLWHLGELLI